MMAKKESSGILIVVISPLPSSLPAAGNRNAIGRRVPSDSLALARAFDLASSSAITRVNALASFFACACCFVAPVGRQDSRAAEIVFGVVVDFERSREDRTSGLPPPPAAAEESSLAADAFLFFFAGSFFGEPIVGGVGVGLTVLCVNARARESMGVLCL